MSSSSSVYLIRNSFDTGELLAAVDLIDEMARRSADPSGLRKDMLRLHAVAHRIINEGPETPSDKALQELTDMASDLSSELWELADKVRKTCDLLDILANAKPPEA